MREIYFVAILVLLSFVLLVSLIAIMEFDKRHFQEGARCYCHHHVYKPTKKDED